MIVERPDPQPYEIIDYEFLFPNGIIYPVSVSEALGDTIDLETSPLATIFHIAPKTSPTDPKTRTPPEDITIMMNHVLTVTKRSRLVTPPSEEERDLFHQTLIKMSKMVN